MQIFDKLLDDGIINKEELILKRRKYIGFKKQEAVFVSKLFKDSEIKDHNFTIKTLSEILKISEDTAQIIVRALVASNCLKVVNNNDEITFNFDYMITRLLETYWAPSKNASLEKQMIWIKEILGFDLNEDNKNMIANWIKDGNWDKVVLVVKKTSLVKDPSWPLLTAAYDSLEKK